MSESPNPAPQQVTPLLALATQFLRTGRPADAIAPLRDAALLQPSNANIQHDLGLACLEVGRIPDAIGGALAAYDRATQLLPSLTEAWFRAGALVYTLGHVAEAIGCFRRAAATGGRSSFGRLGMARA